MSKLTSQIDPASAWTALVNSRCNEQGESNALEACLEVKYISSFLRDLGFAGRNRNSKFGLVISDTSLHDLLEKAPKEVQGGEFKVHYVSPSSPKPQSHSSVKALGVSPRCVPPLAFRVLVEVPLLANGRVGPEEKLW